ncbi:substrate-binding domain-containing protein [Gaiella sp.]|jgi:ABC-type sugar transport system substrate-binding protein|uniref:substrate-binding domain-containing protein n=1 Tax=Gaiella sp. TaxID=2663207 RepID=UPI002E34840E|nr:substrate-binding domain-containing protein [Gaiella sp.]HEX5584292.1 substrate-binding domain-containing protein [Gaiella sp.]
MQGRTKSEVSRRRPLVLGTLLVLVLGAALALVSTSSGSTEARHATATPGMVGAGGGFGEVYKAKTSTLAKTLFSAKLLPKNKMARNISLAAFGRSDKKVNYALALKCWKSNNCTTGTGGKLTVAYVEGFGENVFRQVSKMEFILQALTYPQVGKIIYTSAHSDLNQALTDFRAAISQHVDVIVTYPDFGDAMLPVFKEATKAGIPVVTYAWGYVSGPGKNYTTVVGEDTCKLGKAFAKVMNTQVKSGDIAFMGGFPGNPLSLGWQKCEQKALNPNINVVANEPTNWDPSKVQGVVAGVLAQHPDVKGWSYEDAEFMAEGGYQAYKAAGKPYNAVLTLRTDETALGCLYDKLKNPNLKVYYYTAGNSQIRVAFTAAMMKLQGAKIPPEIVFPIQLQNQAKRSMCAKGYPPSGSATSLVPLSLLKKMYP